MPGYVYMLANKPRGVLYTGVAADLARRIHQHREGRGSAFCRRYGLDRLVWYAEYQRITDAISEEKRIKRWRRAWKVRLIEEMNPGWEDLYPLLGWR
ncbi:GIY-YIG nuclease family protein [Amphiplicatus metriothermophilus]|uniref:Putative endonuclease n=1 Tax=Amphiplicatus metriothermophilus TaxID=1519374 RepID=A0A239PIR3_9PROT|nr:GIY-YIG nuclease family protein [Amphiplicatus metriothermophilus]MBB5517998.1 putative endonuclease [Amphiplicatus metriothermophilus]SNT67668.1 putative endonuclease [Amphiplicatus metriothermophilus]